MSFADLPKRPNILILITDQQSARPHWPAGWEETNLPAMRRLKANGLTFRRGYTASCTCSPSRATLLTGLYPAQHGVTEVLEFDNSVPSFSIDEQGQVQVTKPQVKERRQRALPPGIQNLARILGTAGYNVVYKGKWHLTKPVQFSTSLGQRYWTQADVSHIRDGWGFDGWAMPDAGDNLKVANMGGGATNNDGRFVDGRGQAAKYGELPFGLLHRESVVHFLKTYDSERPFCLIVSLVNPHDVLAFPGTGQSTVTVGSEEVPLYVAGGYRKEDFEDLPIGLPPTVHEDLSTKPRAQSAFRVVSNVGNGLITEQDVETQRLYCQFYAYLCASVDAEIAKLLDALDASGKRDDTLIVRLSDHGDMAMSHGMQRQKMFNVYEETLGVPMIFSNPRLFPQAEETDSLASLVDILPTLATIAGVPDRDRWTFKGRDLTPILARPAVEVQDAVHFTYEDLYFYVPGANHIRALVERDWKYAVYYDVFTGSPPEYELYHLANDPHERHNLAHASPSPTPEIEAERQRLHRKLTRLMDSLGTRPPEIVWPEVSGGEVLVASDLPRDPTEG